MKDLNRTISRRHKLINFVEEKLGEVKYDNEPIGYDYEISSIERKEFFHKHMKEGMLEGIAEIEKALKLIKMSLED